MTEPVSNKLVSYCDIRAPKGALVASQWQLFGAILCFLSRLSWPGFESLTPGRDKMENFFSHSCVIATHQLVHVLLHTLVEIAFSKYILFNR